MSKYKYRMGNGLAFSENKDIELMERMARKGYRPVGANVLGFYRFVKAEPEDVCYSVDFSSVTYGSEEFENYTEIFNDSGWEHVFSIETLHWFKAPAGTVPIYTDQANKACKQENMFQISLKTAILTFAVFLILLLICFLVSFRPVRIVFAMAAGGCLGVSLAMAVGAILNYNRMTKMK